MRLGLTRKLVRSSLKTLSSAPLTASFQIWLCQESQEWIIPNTADGIIPTAMESSIPKPLSIVSLNFHSNRVITENIVPITVDWLIKVTHAMWMPHSSV